MIERDMARAQNEGRAKQKSTALPPANETPSHTNNAPTPSKIPGQNSTPANSTNSAPATEGPGITSDGQMQQVGTDAQSFVQSAVAPVSFSTLQNASSPNFNFSPFTNPGTDGSQEAQASGERLLAALEQNTQMTTSLFNEMLAVIDGQNRALGEVDRKISDLSGQLNSLKNP